MNSILKSLSALPLLFLAVLPSCHFFQRNTQPPRQPTSGPGGAEYRHARVVKNVFGKGADQYWLYEPAEPAPKKAPVVVFLHGWLVTNPKAYGAWIKHLVRRGNIVIYPRYQAGAFTPVTSFTPNAANAIHAAMHRLQMPGHVRPDLKKFAIAGHSIGGAIAANLAAGADLYKIPQPVAVMCVEPNWDYQKDRDGMILDDLRRIRSETLLLTIAGDEDFLLGKFGAEKIFNETTAIPLQNKNMVVFVSDRHGYPPLIADHLAPLAFDDEFDNQESLDVCHHAYPPYARYTVSSMDYYGFWKLLDGLTDAAFYGKNRTFALGNTHQQRFMGTWSDGKPIRELIVFTRPE